MRGKKPNPPAANQKPADGKHVPSAVKGAAVQDGTAALNAHRVTPDQTPQTVGGNPDAPADRQASPKAATGIPYTAGSPTGFSPYMSTY